MMSSFTVSQLNSYVKNMLEEDVLLGDVTVVGEISNFRAHSSGHYYFTLKDEDGAIAAAMFKWQRARMAFVPQDGMRVAVTGKITLYEASGQYQLVAYSIRRDGVGSLYAAFEELKARLSAEGLFSPERKREIPRLPGRIGVVTSPTGAAVQDIMNILARRYPVGEVVLCPVAVQGEEAPAQIAAAIAQLNREAACDVLIVGRGGGSIEDLWAFNTEAVARAVASSAIPVISAVGHETDFTICDFAADLRAPTPSAAAELVAPDVEVILRGIGGAMAAMTASISGALGGACSRVKAAQARLMVCSPARGLETRAQRLDEAATRLHTFTEREFAAKRSALAVVSARLAGCNPFHVLSRGYCAASKDGAVIASAAEAVKANSFTLKFYDGETECGIRSAECGMD